MFLGGNPCKAIPHGKIGRLDVPVDIVNSQAVDRPILHLCSIRSEDQNNVSRWLGNFLKAPKLCMPLFCTLLSLGE